VSVTDLPGGERLDALLKKVTGRPDDINDIAAAWRSESGHVNEFAGALGSAVEMVDDAWMGRSADQFDTYMRKYGHAAEDLDLALANAADSLDAAATALRDAHSAVSAICANLPADAKAGDVDKACVAAKTHVDKADAAVTKAKKDIKDFLQQRSLTFQEIPDVSTQQFTPEPGRTFDWKPDPDYQTSPTYLAGHQGGSGGAPGAGAPGSGGPSTAGYGPSGPPPAGGGPAPTGKVKEWIDQAIELLKAHGVPVAKMNADDIWMIIKHESGGNPDAINNWDSNATAGHPSKGLMQTIDGTFNSYSLGLPGHTSIYDPVANIIAGVRYSISRYGSVSNVPGVVAAKQGGAYVGY
jgi:WXG100 family type VII secretion target